MNGLDQVAIAVGALLLGGVGGFVVARRTQRRVKEAEPSTEAGPQLLAMNEPPRASCVVPQCRSNARLRGLCRKHYGKAYRLGFDGPLTAEQLERLAEDKRKTPKASLAPVLRALPNR